MPFKLDTNEVESSAWIEFARRRKLARESAAKFLPEKRNRQEKVQGLRASAGGPERKMADPPGMNVDCNAQDGGTRLDHGELALLADEDRMDALLSVQRLDLS